MIDVSAITALCALGHTVTILPDGSIRVEPAPDTRSSHARRQAAYRARKMASDAVTKRHEASQTVTRDASVTPPSLPPSPPSPEPPTSPPTLTPVQSAHTHEGLALTADDPKPGKSTVPTSPQAIRLAAVFHRRATTEWSAKEIRAFRSIRMDAADLDAVESYYSAHWPPDRDKNVLRHDLVTLLNNWPGEVDRAHAWAKKAAKPAPASKTDFFAGSSLSSKTIQKHEPDSK